MVWGLLGFRIQVSGSLYFGHHSLQVEGLLWKHLCGGFRVCEVYREPRLFAHRNI